MEDGCEYIEYIVTGQPMLFFPMWDLGMGVVTPNHRNHVQNVTKGLRLG
jgi:hypothetical protein